MGPLQTFKFSWSFLGRIVTFHFSRDERFHYLETEMRKDGPLIHYYLDNNGCMITEEHIDVAISVNVYDLSDGIRGSIFDAIKWAFGGVVSSIGEKQLTMCDFAQQDAIRPIIEMQIALADEKERARKLDFVVSTLENDLDNTKSQNIKMMSQIDSLQQQLKTQREDLQARHFEQMTQILKQNNLHLTPDMKIEADL